jgi:membrane fusion protein (multidrug efflux system)
MRYIIPIGLVLALVAGLAVLKVKQVQTVVSASAAMMKDGPPPEVVGTARASEDVWEDTLSAVGTVAAVRGVAVSAEVPGVVKAIRFESGQVVKAGQVLVELDSSVERAQLASVKARRELATAGVGRTRQLAAKEAASQAQLDSDEAQLKTSAADYSVLEAQIEKKTIRAPFAGRLGIRQVNLGQYLNPGSAITVLESLGAVYVDFALPQKYLPVVRVGSPVRVTLKGVDGGALEGKVGAVDPAVDAATRSIKLRASVPDPKQRLRPGMFVEVTLVRDEKTTVVRVPATAVVHAAYGDSVFIVENGAARQQFVRLGAARGDFVAILAGVNAGQEVVTAGAFKLRNGSRVVVNNAVAPTPALDPAVENL